MWSDVLVLEDLQLEDLVVLKVLLVPVGVGVIDINISFSMRTVYQYRFGKRKRDVLELRMVQRYEVTVVIERLDLILTTCHGIVKLEFIKSRRKPRSFPRRYHRRSYSRL